jgi:hypothetical protein
MDPTNPLANQVSQLRKMWFVLVQPEPPDSFDRTQVEQQLIEFGKELVVMGKITPDELRGVLEESNYNKKILDLIELVTKASFSVKEENFNSRLQQMVSEYEEHLKTEAHNKEQEAQAYLAKQNKSELRDKIKQSFDNLQKQVTEADKAAVASEYLAVSQNEMETQLVSSPTETAQIAASLLKNASNIDEKDMPNVVSPLSDPISELSPAIGTFKTVVENQISEAASNLDPEKLAGAAAETVAFKIVNPDASAQETENFIHNLTVKIESSGTQVNGKIAGITETILDFKLALNPNENLESVIANEFQTQAGLDAQTAKEISRIIMANKLPLVSYAVARSSPTSPNDSPEKRKQRQIHAFGQINQTILESLSNQIPKSTFSQILKLSNYQRIWEASQYLEPNIYNQDNFRTTDSQGGYSSNQALDFLQNQGSSFLKSEAKEAWLNYIGAGAGGIAASSLTWAMPAEISVVAAASIEQALTNGWIVYAGTNSLGQLTFTATELGKAAIKAGAKFAGSTALVPPAVEAGAVAGQAVPIPVIGPIIGAILAYIATNFPQIWEKIKNFTGPIIGGLFVGGFTLVSAIAAGFSAAGIGVVTVGGVVAGAIGGGKIISGISTAPATAIKSVGSFAGGVLASVTTVAIAEIAVPVIIIIASIPPVVALLLFIINSSAYMVPASSFRAGNLGSIDGCPAQMWPVSLDQGQTYYIRQGPGGEYSHGPGPENKPEPYSISYEEAIDITPHAYNANNHLIVATHPGTVVNSAVDGFGGNYIRILDNCGGNFQTLYVHMLVNYAQQGQVINTGDIIGVMGKTGYATGEHLHYAFANADGSKKKRTDDRTDPPPYMIMPYIPKDVPQYCVYGFAVDCKVEIP